MKVLGCDHANSERTQTRTTDGSYQKVADWIGGDPGEGTILDFGAGLGHGSGILGACSLEPFPCSRFAPDYQSFDALEGRQFNTVVCLNVINVLPPAILATVLDQICATAQSRVIIGARSKSCIMTASVLKNAQAYDMGTKEVLTSVGTYQRGFDKASIGSLLESRGWLYVGSINGVCKVNGIFEKTICD